MGKEVGSRGTTLGSGMSLGYFENGDRLKFPQPEKIMTVMQMHGKSTQACLGVQLTSQTGPYLRDFEGKPRMVIFLVRF